MHQVEILKVDVADPTAITVEFPATTFANEPVSLLLKSYDSDGLEADIPEDTFEIEVIQTDGDSTEPISATATYIGDSIYETSFVPTDSGVYSVRITYVRGFDSLAVEIEGSPFVMEVTTDPETLPNSTTALEELAPVFLVSGESKGWKLPSMEDATEVKIDTDSILHDLISFDESSKEMKYSGVAIESLAQLRMTTINVSFVSDHVEKTYT